MIKSLIYSLTRTYYIQNSSIKDFKTTLTNFHQRLLNRGYSHSTIYPIFQSSIKKILQDPTVHKLCNNRHTISSSIPIQPPSPSTLPTTTTTTFEDKTLYIHLEYHPQDISRQKIRTFYESACNLPDIDNQSFNLGIRNRDDKVMTISKATIAYSRPKNLRDHLCSTKLHLTDSNTPLQTYINTNLYPSNNNIPQS